MKMKRASDVVLPTAIGVAAGLRSMTAPAILVWAARRRVIRFAGSSLASMALGTFSGRTTKLAVTELLMDKLPFAPDRTSPGPLAWRVLSGAACGAAVTSSLRRPAWEGAALGAGGAVAGALVGNYMRKRVRRTTTSIIAGFAEDAVAVGIASAVVWQLSRDSSAR